MGVSLSTCLPAGLAELPALRRIQAAHSREDAMAARRGYRVRKSWAFHDEGTEPLEDTWDSWYCPKCGVYNFEHRWECRNCGVKRYSD